MPKYAVNIFQEALGETENIHIHRMTAYPEPEYDDAGEYTQAYVDAYKEVVRKANEEAPLCVASTMDDARLIVAALNAWEAAQ